MYEPPSEAGGNIINSLALVPITSSPSAWLAAFCCRVRSFGQSGPSADSPSATKDRVNSQRWWPTKGTASFRSVCWSERLRRMSFRRRLRRNAHAHGAGRVSAGAARADLRKSLQGALQNGPYLYRISSSQLGSRLAVSSGNNPSQRTSHGFSARACMARPTSSIRRRHLYESQVSSFAALHGMDLTPGHTQMAAGKLKNALGEQLSTSAAARCFALPHHLFDNGFQI